MHRFQHLQALIWNNDNYFLANVINFLLVDRFTISMYRQYFQALTFYQLNLLYHLSLFSFIFIIIP